MDAVDSLEHLVLDNEWTYYEAEKYVLKNYNVKLKDLADEYKRRRIYDP